MNAFLNVSSSYMHMYMFSIDMSLWKIGKNLYECVFLYATIYTHARSMQRVI